MTAPPGPLRVLIISPVADLYGSTRSMLETLDRIEPAAVRAAWALPDEGPLSHELRARKSPFVVMPHLRLARVSDSPATRIRKVAEGLLSSSMRVASLIRRNRIDVVHSNSAAVLAGAYGAMLGRTPHLWYVRELIPDQGLLTSLLRREIQRRSDAVLCVSTAVAAQLDMTAPPYPRVVHSGIDWERMKPRDVAQSRRLLGLPAEALVLGSSGYLNPRKGMDLLLEAYARIRPEVEGPARLLLAGEPFPGNEGFARSLRERSRALGLEDEVVMPGYLHDISHFFSAIDVFALTNREPEGLGRSVLEAMASGRPVLASGIGGALDIIDPESSGLLVDPCSTESITMALRRLVNQPEFRTRLGEAGRRAAGRRFRLEFVAEQLLATYKHLGGIT